MNKNLKSWALYDFANSSYVLIFQAFLLPVFFSTILKEQGFTNNDWGLANGCSTFLGVILSIFVGRYSDNTNRLSVFTKFIIASFLGMILVSICVGFYVKYVFVAYILTNALFITTLSLSDSILPHIAQKKQSFEYSGFAWGFGYLGGVICLIFVMIAQKFLGDYSPFVFGIVAVFYILFSTIAYKGLKNTDLNSKEESNSQEIKVIAKSDKVKLLMGYWLISECITVIILFYSIYATTEMKLSSTEVAITLLVVQLIAFPATWFGGKLTSKYSSLTLLKFSIFIWLIVILLLVLNIGLVGLVFIVILTGLVIGNSQSFLRAYYAEIIEKNKSGYEFGLYSIISQASVIASPILFGLLSDKLGSQKIPLIVFGILMLVGYFISENVLRKKNTSPNTVLPKLGQK